MLRCCLAQKELFNTMAAFTPAPNCGHPITFGDLTVPCVRCGFTVCASCAEDGREDEVLGELGGPVAPVQIDGFDQFFKCGGCNVSYCYDCGDEEIPSLSSCDNCGEFFCSDACADSFGLEFCGYEECVYMSCQGPSCALKECINCGPLCPEHADLLYVCDICGVAACHWEGCYGRLRGPGDFAFCRTCGRTVCWNHDVITPLDDCGHSPRCESEGCGGALARCAAFSCGERLCDLCKLPTCASCDGQFCERHWAPVRCANCHASCCCARCATMHPTVVDCAAAAAHGQEPAARGGGGGGGGGAPVEKKKEVR